MCLLGQRAPSTMLRVVPLPRFAGEDRRRNRRGLNPPPFTGERDRRRRWRGHGRVRSRRLRNHHQNSFERGTVQNVRGRHPQHLKPLPAQPSVASFVMRNLPRVIMMPPVDFHGEPALGAEEVQDVGANWMLPSEAQSFQPPCPQAIPKHHLRQAHVPAKAPGSFECSLWRAQIPYPSSIHRSATGCARGCSSTAGSGAASPSFAAFNARCTSTERYAISSAA